MRLTNAIYGRLFPSAGEKMSDVRKRSPSVLEEIDPTFVPFRRRRTRQ